MSKLYIMCGIPASGKSTWIKNNIKPNEVWVSRDEIRKKLVNTDENDSKYFSKEKEVYKIFIETIDKNINKGYNVYADATHISKASRSKLLNAIKSKPNEIEVIWVHKDLKTCLKQNRNRKGFYFVPEEVIKNMFNSFEKPKLKEGFDNIKEVR